MKRIIVPVILTSALLLASAFLSSAEVKDAEEKKDRKGLLQKTLEMPGDIMKAAGKPLAAAAGAKADKTGKDEKKPNPITDAELREHILELFESEDDIIASVPDLRKTKDGYTYQGTRFEDLTREALDKIYKAVINEVGRVRAERLNRQLQQIAQSSRAASMMQQTVRPPTLPVPPPPQPPKVLQPPPPPPSAPPQVYNPPRPQTPPPAPPRR